MQQLQRLIQTTWSKSWIWLCTVLLGVVLIAALLEQERHQEKSRIDQQSLMLSLLEVRDALETDLAIGFELSENQRLPNLLDEKLAQNTTLSSLDIISPNGWVLFSSNRALQSLPTPAVVRQQLAIQIQPSDWQANTERWQFVGTPITNAHGQHVAFAMLSKATSNQEHEFAPDWLSTRFLLVTCFAALVSLATGFACALLMSIRQQKTLPLLDQQSAFNHVESVQRQLQSSLEQLDSLERRE